MTDRTKRNDHSWARAKWAFAVFALVAAFFLLAEHRAHVLPFLPWLALLACPLMHFFMHGGHGGHGGSHGDGSGRCAGPGGSSGAEPEGSHDRDRGATGE